jgi:hypothetical protein
MKLKEIQDFFSQHKLSREGYVLKQANGRFHRFVYLEKDSKQITFPMAYERMYGFLVAT